MGWLRNTWRLSVAAFHDAYQKGAPPARIEVEKLPALVPGDMLVCYMPPEWTPTVEERERWLDGVQRAVGKGVTLVVMPAGVRIGVMQQQRVVVNNTVGGEPGPEIMVAAVRRGTGEGI